eukprot:CAMPEP_0113940602 /NCGR_PEP_ID=MMETSP1339-20121228/6708_1 /TAXON_ID=94617 /ORGANISM="Fibrocapsa japonica" /LENGTH=212 /DNA_ID=CAMNT_0000944493 /DNA_START=157 /DNA_END=795 /DNA_ORIENTATION=+ /assembly_acc=CAM_ASM_000762
MDNETAMEACQEIEHCLQSAKGVKQSFTTELRLLGDKVEEQHYKMKLRRYEERMSALTERLNGSREAIEKEHLMRGAQQRRGGGGFGDSDDPNDAMLGKAEKLQDDIEDAYGRAENDLDEIRQLAPETLAELRNQREKIQDITETAERIDDLLTRADRLLRTFGRRMATDRLIQVFFFINACLLLAVIIYAIVSDSNLTGGSGSKAPDPNSV